MTDASRAARGWVSHDQGALCLPLGSVAVKGRDHVAFSTSLSCDQASGWHDEAWSKLVPHMCAPFLIVRLEVGAGVTERRGRELL